MQNSILYLIAGLILGATISWFALSSRYETAQNKSTSVITNENDSDSMQNEHSESHTEGMTMDRMSSSLNDKTGDDFDKEFIIQMIEHHEGAIKMAEQAASNAKHSEIIKMSEDIINTQSEEIEMLKQWKIDWGY